VAAPHQNSTTGSISADDVRRVAKDLGRNLSRQEAEATAAYVDLLVRWNARMNLVGHATGSEILTDLVADSWHLADLLEEVDLSPSPRCLDLGAGAGLPGIPLRIVWPDGDYHLVEPREKRALFLKVAVASLRLARTHVVQGRVEELPEDLAPADLIVSRAFRPWAEYLEIVRPLLAPAGVAVVFASEPPEAARSAPGVRLVAERAYVSPSSPSGSRWLWAFTPASISS
jgi:16S rRNA (guanine527-N7)-methyltransferase